MPGASVVVSGVHLPLGADGPPHVLVGPHNAHVTAASRQSLRVVVPSQSEGGTTSIRITFGLRNAPESWRDYVYWNVELDDA